MHERIVVSKQWIVHVMISRIDMVVYGEKHSGRISASEISPIREEIPEIDTTVTQESIAGAVGSAIAILNIRSPQSEREKEDE